MKNEVCSMESELTMSPEQIKNTAESSVEFFLDNHQQELEQIVSDIKSVSVVTDNTLLRDVAAADGTIKQISGLKEALDQ